jgi:hypothetical protein
MIDKLFHGEKQTKTIYSVKKRWQTTIIHSGKQTKTVTHSKKDIRQVFHGERNKRQYCWVYCRKIKERVFFGWGINRQGGRQVFRSGKNKTTVTQYNKDDQQNISGRKADSDSKLSIRHIVDTLFFMKES